MRPILACAWGGGGRRSAWHALGRLGSAATPRHSTVLRGGRHVARMCSVWVPQGGTMEPVAVWRRSHESRSRRQPTQAPGTQRLLGRIAWPFGVGAPSHLLRSPKLEMPLECLPIAPWISSSCYILPRRAFIAQLVALLRRVGELLLVIALRYTPYS